MKPKRIQRKRTKGWRMPGNTVSVTRPGIYGNPFSEKLGISKEVCIALYKNMVRGVFDPTIINQLSDANFDAVYQAHSQWLKRIGDHPTEFIRRELRGKNLACFCKVGDPCHADILLAICND